MPEVECRAVSSVGVAGGAGAAPGNDRGTEVEISDVKNGAEAFGVIRELGEWGPGAVISEAGLAKLLHRHPVSIKRAVVRGELPAPVRWFCQNVWTLKSILDHLEGRLAVARKARESMLKKISQI